MPQRGACNLNGIDIVGVHLSGISSMATRQLLAELGAAYERAGRGTVRFESVGGVEAAKRVQAGEGVDLVVLASDAIAKLAAEGHVLEASVRPVVRSEMAVAVRSGAARPDIGSEPALKRSMLAARGIGYSTGPSGVALLRLVQAWGLTAELSVKLVQAPPGVPVARLIAEGQVELGFQQLSELIGQEGVELIGPMPAGLEITTVFSGAIGARAAQAIEAQALLDFLCAPQADEIKRRCGLEPA